MFDPSVFTNADSIAFLEKLNSFNWYHNRGTTIGVDVGELKRAVAACDTRRQRAQGTLVAATLTASMTMQQSRMAKIVRLLSQMVAQGPKVFQPTHELCSYFENVDVTLPISDYEQSYPVVVVRLPQTYVDSRGIGFPFVACLFEREHRHLTTLASHLFAFPLDSTTITPNEASIEDALSDIRYMDDTKCEWDTRLDAVRLPPSDGETALEQGERMTTDIMLRRPEDVMEELVGAGAARETKRGHQASSRPAF